MHSTHQTVLILFFVTFAAIATIIPYCNAKLILLNQYPLAKCLDGSPSGYYFVPATNDAKSSAITLLLNNTRDTFFCIIRVAKPSAIADLPTPGSPINNGLFFLRLDNI